ncbi:hypothetical protein EJV46_01085 [Roseococcus sp. SYP-B2431]|nr:hypothetical protein EJV46_01085 [Roseococcus sp. SYP-B2431]
MKNLVGPVSAIVLLAACQQMPTGPTASEGMYNSLVAQCSAQGGRDRRGENACRQANTLAGQVAGERAQRDSQAASVAQNNAITTGVAGAAAGVVGGALIGGALSGPRYGYGYRGYGPYGYRCGYWGC